MLVSWTTVFIDLPAVGYRDGLEFWLAVTGGSASPVRGPEGEFLTVLPPSGDAYLRVQRVRDGEGGAHLDLHVTEPLEDAADRARSLGARLRHAEPGLVVLESPGGFGFCLVPTGSESTVPGPTTVEGLSSRLDQLCLDIPAPAFDAERDFWATLTGWRLDEEPGSEFAVLHRPPGIPARLLLQRLDRAEPGRPVRAHLDLAAGADREALAERHVALGARFVARFPQWIVLTDPAGRLYCLTRRDPVTGVSRPDWAERGPNG